MATGAGNIGRRTRELWSVGKARGGEGKEKEDRREGDERDRQEGKGATRRRRREERDDGPMCVMIYK